MAQDVGAAARGQLEVDVVVGARCGERVGSVRNKTSGHAQMCEQRPDNPWERFHRDWRRNGNSRWNPSHKFRGVQSKKQVFAASFDLSQCESVELRLKIGRDGPAQPSVSNDHFANLRP